MDMFPATPFEQITISPSDMGKMLQDINAHFPEEACGLLVGKNLIGKALVEIAIPMTNILHSPTKFRLDPKEQYDVFCWMDAHRLELVGVYHSHPNGPPYPSFTDLEEAYYPEIVHIIWAKLGGKWKCRAFVFETPKFREIEIQSTDI